MSKAISNTSPLLYLHRIGVLNWLPRLFTEIWIPKALCVNHLEDVGMWISDEIRERVLILAGEERK